MAKWHVTLTFLMITITSGRTEPSYQLREIPDHPGLFYERLPDMKVYTTTWKIVSYINVSAFLDYKPWSPTEVYRLRHKCTSHLLPDQCEGLVATKLLNDRITRIKQLKMHITRIVLPHDKQVPHRQQERRGAPLAFIGTISHALFGTITEDEANFYENRISQLEKEKGDLAHVMENATHIVRGAINDLGAHVQAAELNVAEIANATTSLQLALLREETETRKLEYALQLHIHANTLLNSANLYIEKLQMFYDAMLDARQGSLHPSLISIDQLRKAESHVNTNTSLEFPISVTNAETVLDISAISHLTTKYHNGLLLVSLTLPLLEPSTFQVHRLYPCLRSQRNLGISQGTAYVQPVHPYLAWSNERGKYFSFDREYLKTCYRLSNTNTCPMRIALRDVHTDETCEAKLLLSPTTGTLKKCDVRLARNSWPQWTYLENTNGWLYSLMDPETLHIQCHNGVSETLVVRETGILQLGIGCTAYSAHITLPPTDIISTSIHSVFYPPTTLNISELSPTMLEAHEILTPIVVSGKTSVLDGQLLRADVSLEAAEMHLKELSKTRPKKWYRNPETWTYSGIGLSLVTLLGLLFGILRTNLLGSLLYCCTGCCKKYESRPSPRITREDIVGPPVTLQPSRLLAEPRRPAPILPKSDNVGVTLVM